MKSEVITSLFSHKFSLVLKWEDFTGPRSLPWYFFHINLGSTNQKIRGPSSAPEDYQFESLGRAVKIWTGEEEKRFFIPHEKVSFKEWPWARHLTLIFSTQVPIVKVCSVFGFSGSWYDWRKCECAASVKDSENLLSVNKSIQKVGFWEFGLTDSLTSVRPMFWNIIQTWNHLKIFQLLLLKAPRSAMGTEDLDLGKWEWYRYATENQLALVKAPKYS